VVTWLDAGSTPLASSRLLPKPNGDLHIVDAAIEDTQVLKCLITGTGGGNQANAPEMIVYEHVLFGELCESKGLITTAIKLAIKLRIKLKT